MNFRVLALAILVAVAAPAFAAGDQPAALHALGTFPANKPVKLGPSTEALDGTAFYSNVTNFLGLAFANGGAAVDPAAPANTITRLLCDDNTYNGATGRTLTGYNFAVSNLNAAVVTARPRVRFYADNAGVPGAYLAGNSFNPLAFPVGVTVYSTGPLGTPTAFPGTGAAVKIWACITFDNNSGATGAVVADLNNLGVGLFNPPDRGTSANQYFVTTANGSFVSSNPPGATGTINGTIANFGFQELDSVTMPVELQSFEVK